MARAFIAEKGQGLVFRGGTVSVKIFLGFRTEEARMHKRMQRAGLELRDVISWEEIPMAQEDDSIALETWPIILPHVLARRSDVYMHAVIHA